MYTRRKRKRKQTLDQNFTSYIIHSSQSIFLARKNGYLFSWTLRSRNYFPVRYFLIFTDYNSLYISASWDEPKADTARSAILNVYAAASLCSSWRVCGVFGVTTTARPVKNVVGSVWSHARSFFLSFFLSFSVWGNWLAVKNVVGSVWSRPNPGNHHVHSDFTVG